MSATRRRGGRRASDRLAAEALAAAGRAPSPGAARPERWSSTYAFVLALAGAAIGFKTVWQFPYLAGENGGGAFVLIYLLLAFLVGAPLLIAQIMLGRSVHASPVKAFADLGARARGRRRWGIVGAVAIAGGVIIFSYLSVIAGWTAAYFVRAAFGTLAGLTADGLSGQFAVFVKDPEKQIFWHTLFTLACATIAARGVRHGLEPAVRWCVPTLYAALLLLAAYTAPLGGLEDALRYVFTPDFTKLTPNAWLLALAQVFFSLGLGTGVALMYGAYLKADASIARAALTVVGIDVLTSVVTAVTVLGLLFGGAVAPASGPTLMFQVLPLAFDHLPLGRAALSVFFALLVLVALVMGIALLEPAIVWFEERWAMRRQRATVAVAAGAWALGLITIFSFNYAAFSYKFLGIEKNLGAFDILQSVTAEAMLPLAGFAMAIFAGWMLKTNAVREELALRLPCAFDAWLWLLRLLAPPALLVLLFTVYRL